MNASSEFRIGELGEIDSSTSLTGLGEVGLPHPVHDMDGDGSLDTATGSNDDALIVLTDADLDGMVDHLTIVDHDGDFAAWEFRHVGLDEARWERIDHGKLGE